ncbi:MAG: hypothetical protein H0U04_00985 [Rubrobacter sp.]|nr:hypothetical protein [Rubrobacter sp.]
MTAPHPRALASTLTNVLNPFFIFTALFALAAFARSPAPEALLYLGLELLAAAFVVVYVFLMRRRRRVGDFWISARAERLVPAIFLLSAFVGLLAALWLLDAPGVLVLTTLSMGLAAATVAAVTLVWKTSAHTAVAGHAAVAGLLVLGPVGLIFVLALPLVLYARVGPWAHTLPQALAGVGVGAAFAAVFLV